MGLFKDVKKPVIRQASRATADISPLRPRFVESRPPCASQCAAGVDVRGWVTVIAQPESHGIPFDQAREAAWRILADAHPFPATLGRVCPHPCERACHRAGKDEALAINTLEAWLGDAALARRLALPLASRSSRTGRVAIAGAGPAGLSCAYQLARRGHRVEVFEAREVPGGRLRDATRTGRLDAAIVDAEIARVLDLGIVLHCGTARLQTGEEAPADADFVFVATGRRSEPMSADEYGRTDRARVVTGGDAVRPGLVAAAIESGRRAALAIDAAINGAPPPQTVTRQAIGAERITLSWYETAPRLSAEASEARRDESMIAEAKRCLSCGLCMDCEQCWMFCTNNCFEKLPKGQHYRLNVEPCNGCRKCADECPCGYIEMV